jgi:hypothetical protein
VPATTAVVAAARRRGEPRRRIIMDRSLSLGLTVRR